ncbi:unnamed protein product [Bursaphelenchus xylophilus]|uniref:(pine wood nematode) hypothetical protein n=1 Tax=Bursaphelenchus xylophilus TaxID=6326 RepID=A0A1I7RY40_BURXY|nr:unnamed protein product [Bursaphelenchus xylophilus]CAG9085255.1 unnamed protein product [Bursaphelenchus xylophilus]
MTAEYQTKIKWDDEVFSAESVLPSEAFLGFITAFSEGELYSIIEVQLIPGNLILISVEVQLLKRHKFKQFKLKEAPQWYHKPYPFCEILDPPESSEDHFDWRRMGVKREGVYCDLLVPVVFFNKKCVPKPTSNLTVYRNFNAEISYDFCFENNVGFSPIVGPVVFFGDTAKFNRHTFYYVWVSRPRNELLAVIKEFNANWIVKNSETKMKRVVTSLDISFWHLNSIRSYDYGLVVGKNEEECTVEIFVSEHIPLITGYVKQCFPPARTIRISSWVRFSTCKYVNDHEFAINLVRVPFPKCIKRCAYAEELGLVKIELYQYWINEDEDWTLGCEIGDEEHIIYNPEQIKLQRYNNPLITYSRNKHKFYLRSMILGGQSALLYTKEQYLFKKQCEYNGYGCNMNLDQLQSFEYPK